MEDVAATGSQFAETMIDNMGRVVPRSLAEVCPKASPEALDLMAKLLRFNPHKRYTAAEALEHPYLAAFHNIKDEPAAPGPITISLPDDTRYTVNEYRDRLYLTIASRRRSEKDKQPKPGNQTPPNLAGTPPPQAQPPQVQAQTQPSVQPGPAQPQPSRKDSFSSQPMPARGPPDAYRPTPDAYRPAPAAPAHPNTQPSVYTGSSYGTAVPVYGSPVYPNASSSYGDRKPASSQAQQPQVRRAPGPSPNQYPSRQFPQL